MREEEEEKLEETETVAETLLRRTNLEYFSFFFPYVVACHFPAKLCRHLLDILRTAASLFVLFSFRLKNKHTQKTIFRKCLPAGNPRGAVETGQAAERSRGR